MLSDAAILDILHGLNFLSQEEFLTTLLISTRTLRSFINPLILDLNRSTLRFEQKLLRYGQP
jgi:hypothetical protein